MSEAEEAQLMVMQTLQLKDGMKTYNKIVKKCASLWQPRPVFSIYAYTLSLLTSCYEHCVTGFRIKKLEKGEQECVTICYKKFLNFQQLVQKHWTLENQRMVEEQQIAQAHEQGLIK